MGNQKNNSKTSGKNELLKIESEQQTLDQRLEEIVVTMPMGDIIRMHETARDARDHFLASLILDAIMTPSREASMRAVKRIINRLDGSAPKDVDKDQYKSRVGDAIDAVLDIEDAEKEKLSIGPGDTVLFAIAKSIVWVAVTPPEECKTPDQKNMKDVAVGIILERCGGRKSTPLRSEVKKVYAEPDWLKLEGEDDDLSDL